MAKSLQELTNRVLAFLDEPGANPGGPPAIPPGAVFSQALITDLLNEGVAVFIEESGYAPSLVDKLLIQAVTATQDFLLPADLVALQRLEYMAGNAPPPVLVPLLSFDQFDIYTGGAYQNTGTPQVARVPFAGAIRFWPFPSATNVTNNDQAVLYYSSYGTALTNLADTVNLPNEFQEAPAAYALSRGFSRKHAPNEMVVWEKRFLRLCERAKTKIWANDMAADFQITDAEAPTGESLYSL